ncbi:hypothetical protein [Rosistilla oblonga]|uniref:hypothetical protein n=1 Tax=Rosistilla oblonga TaxID=2527990 RepID=UPI003A968ECF
MDEPYIFNETDCEVVELTMQLLAKIWQSDLVSEEGRGVVTAMAAAINEMPNGVHDYFNASVTLTGPRRKFGEHEIYHYWTVELEGGEFRVDASGYFYRPSTGGDNFTSFSWVAIPGYITDCRNFLKQIAIVDDAQPFGSEIAGIDLSEPGYQVRVEVDGEPLGSEEDPEEGELNEYEHYSNPVRLSVCLWAFFDAEYEMIYALAGRVYAIGGSDEEVLDSLKSLSRHDFRTVQRVEVPSRFGVLLPDGKQQCGLASPSLLNDPDAMLFNELIDELENSLPPISDFVNEKTIKQTLGDAPLTCRTLVYEESTGACRAIVDPSDVDWLRSRTSAL